MCNYLVYTYSLHVDNMFEEMPVMASRGPHMFLFNLFLLHHCLPVLLPVLSYHSILGSVVVYGPK